MLTDAVCQLRLMETPAPGLQGRGGTPWEGWGMSTWGGSGWERGEEWESGRETSDCSELGTILKSALETKQIRSPLYFPYIKKTRPKREKKVKA